MNKQLTELKVCCLYHFSIKKELLQETLTDNQRMREILKTSLSGRLDKESTEWQMRLSILVSSLSSVFNTLLLINDNNLKQTIAEIFEFQFVTEITITDLTNKLQEFIENTLNKLTEIKAGVLFFSLYDNLDVLLCQQEDREAEQDSYRRKQLFEDFEKQCA